MDTPYFPPFRSRLLCKSLPMMASSEDSTIAASVADAVSANSLSLSEAPDDCPVPISLPNRVLSANTTVIRAPVNIILAVRKAVKNPGLGSSQLCSPRGRPCCVRWTWRAGGTILQGANSQDGSGGNAALFQPYSAGTFIGSKSAVVRGD